MDSKSIRYQNTRLLVDSVGGVSNFADKIGKGQSQTSQFAGTNPIKGIGNKVAREIEDAFEKPYGWLDILHTDVNELSANFNSSLSNIQDEVTNENKEFLRLINTLNLLNSNGQLSPEMIKALYAVIALGN
ncbi:hypothetical protein [Acinetobacter populi]|uniref:Uncharacterized protein n=1 Tax=Acinetobacter populi TaxID=1582270 RepID=A0A1Z9YXT8_9GAMM|nr:hypothetical protein [Acinetobacter populi]OUY07024.1 hypothetical protein CAP51_10040 [Acinetobacter populi]